MKKNIYISRGIAASTILLILVGSALSMDSFPVVVNLMIDINAPMSPNSIEEQIAFDSIVNLTNGIGPKGLNATLFPTGDAIPSQRLHITYLANMSNYEVAMGGMKKDEMIGSNSSSDQKALLSEMKKYVEACHICGGKDTEPQGFKPQSFDQNADTYQILNQMGILYDAGFQAGVLYLPGHENDTWAYRIDNLDVYAIPVSTYPLQGERILLSDRVAREEKKLTGPQWYDILVDKFEESGKRGDPIVLIFDNQISGTDAEYLKAYLNFLDYALSKNATFVKTSEFVKISKAVKPIAPSGKTAIMSNEDESGCVACDAHNNATVNATIENESSPAEIEVSITQNFND
jgi:hypothetical protein